MPYGIFISGRMCFFDDQNFQRPLFRMLADLLRNLMLFGKKALSIFDTNVSHMSFLLGHFC